MSESKTEVLQATAWYPPYNLGGTEVYLENLISELFRLGIKSKVIVPSGGSAPESYLHEGAQVDTYPVNAEPFEGEMRHSKTHLGFDVFLRHLRENRTAIYHQHSWTRGCGSLHLRAAKNLGMRTILTVHVPGAVCLRGTMLKFGKGQCDGFVDGRVCGACWAQGRGLPRAAAQLFSHLPLSAAQRARQSSFRFATALAAGAIGAERVVQLRGMAESADKIVAVCQWLYDALVANGVPKAKLTLSRQGISNAMRSKGEMLVRKKKKIGALRLLYLGRWDPVKGIDIVVRALRSLPALDARLSIVGLPQDKVYEDQVSQEAKDDARIMILPPVPRSDLPALMAEHEVLVVPSVGLETGPLVVLEANAVGMHVLGARLGGIAELVDEADGGTLVTAADVAAWAEAIRTLSAKHAKGQLAGPTKPVRTMDMAARDMAEIYQSFDANRIVRRGVWMAK